tara:strand:+ start:782 stop:1276 length:495 start_codon:yes stop_codon:yes gene_type:complete
MGITENIDEFVSKYHNYQQKYKNIWICPSNENNLEKTIKNKYNGEYIWAFNSNREKSYNEMEINDICLFGNLRKNGGFNYLGIVKGKKILEYIDDEWPFKSPSGTHWKYAFTLDIHKIDLSPQKARYLRGWKNNQSWQSQTKLTNDTNKMNFVNYLNTLNLIYI